MLELNKLNEEKRALQQQLRVTTETHDKHVGELERAGEEMEGHYVKLLEEKKSELEDLRLQLDSVEKQLKSNRQFLEVRVQKGHPEWGSSYVEQLSACFNSCFFMGDVIGNFHKFGHY